MTSYIINTKVRFCQVFLMNFLFFSSIYRLKIEIFEEGTAQFEDAMQKISQGLLDVLYSQFGSKPQTLVAGGIVEETQEEQKDVSDDSMLTDDSLVESLEDDDDE